MTALGNLKSVQPKENAQMDEETAKSKTCSDVDVSDKSGSVEQSKKVAQRAEDGLPTVTQKKKVTPVIEAASCLNNSGSVEPSEDLQMEEESSKSNNVSDVDDSESCSPHDLITVTRRKKVATNCKQVYDKSSYCTYCSKMISSKISRHLLIHKGEKEIADILLLPKRSRERMMRLQQLANEGNFKHNTSVLASGRGHPVVGRRSAAPHIDARKFLSCEFCHKFK